MNDIMPPAEDRATALKQLLENKSSGLLARLWLWIACVLLVLAVTGLLMYRSWKNPEGPRYTTEPVEAGTLVVTVSATGKLQPTNQVDVGSELSGIVDQVYVDVNDHVKKGQVLARLDLAKLRDAVAKSQASLAAAEAQVLQAQATVAETHASLSRYRQVFQLSGGKVPSRSEMDTAEANLKRAEANEAAALAGVIQAKAALRSNETDLAKAFIRSPINGVVLKRQVEPGQTVAASFQAPVLFTLAEDLSKMELQVDVDEADVGQVREGQKAVFSVDAWPGRRYKALVTRVGYGAQEKDGVVSYLTVLQVENADLSLRPGMTGTAEITTLTLPNVLLVPNAALRFTPPETDVTQKKKGGNVLSALLPRPPSQAPKVKSTAGNVTPRVWVLRDGRPEAVEVRTGATNGKMTEIKGGALKAGVQVITESVSGRS